jgi:hypothetical protein
LIEGARKGSTESPYAPGIVIGELVAIAEEGRTPLVCYPKQPGSAALRARTAVDLHGAHIGRALLLMFEEADARRPLIIGVLRDNSQNALSGTPGNVEVDADGERMVVTAKQQLVLRCGKACLTLTKDGKVLIEGTYLLSRSSGVNSIKGGSIQLN